MLPYTGVINLNQDYWPVCSSGGHQYQSGAAFSTQVLHYPPPGYTHPNFPPPSSAPPPQPHPGYSQAPALHALSPNKAPIISNKPPVASSTALPQPPAVASNQFHILSQNPSTENPAPAGSGRRQGPFTVKELFEIVQTAVDIRYFEAGHGEKGKREAYSSL